MKISLNPSLLYESVSILSKVIHVKDKDSVLSNIKMITDSNRIFLVGSDGLISCRSSIPAIIVEPGSALANLSILKDTSKSIKTLSNVDLSGNEGGISIKANGICTVKSTGAVSEFPDLGFQSINFNKTFSIAISDIKLILNEIVYAAYDKTIIDHLAQDGTVRPSHKVALDCVQMLTDDKYITVTCTDTYRLASKNITLFSGALPSEIRMPVRFFQMIPAIVKARSSKKSIKKDQMKLYEDDSIQFMIIDNKIFASDGGALISCSQSNLPFPDWKSVVKGLSGDKSVTVSKKDFSNALSMATASQDKDTRSITVSCDGEKIRIAQKSDESSFSIAHGACKFEIMMNRIFLRDMLSSISSEEIVMRPDFGRKGLCQFDGKSGDRHLLMPMILRK